ncbi:MAG: hypothetical protein K6G65_02170 [Lachnospiraceae bacterium]|nr:hypothetical protein [Lachnospiraceae bacterium]
MKQKITKKFQKTIITIISLLCIICVCTACTEDFFDEESNDADAITSQGENDRISGLGMEVDNSKGELTISRKEIGADERADDGSWTVFVYLCGTDLESQSGMGTADMKEMIKSSHSKKVRFVVQTGGTDGWNYDKVDDASLQRFVIRNGKVKKVDERELASMGSPDTLADFLTWGTKKYASEHMGLVMWNHGGGSITGVCFDEKYKQDAITLTEMDAALSDCAKSFQRKFDFIGYDACLMGTVETANVLATYADYMYGSEEMEPGSGWDYTAVGNFLAKNPDADGAKLGKVVSDSFLESCKKQQEDAIVTFSVIDLSKIDNLLINFNRLAKNMYELGEDSTQIAEMIREIEQADNFGGNNKTEGYTNMVDLGGLCDASKSYVKGADKAKKALEDAVVYKVSGSDHRTASGLSIYYPLLVQGSNELSVFEKIAVSPYYLSFVDRLNKTAATDNDFADYDDEQWFEDDGSWNWGENEDESYWEYLDSYEQTGESPYITFYEEPQIWEDGTYGFVLDENGISNAAGVCAFVYEVSEDGKSYVEIGETTDVNGDWNTGEFSDGFDGYWLSLPDGQNLATYIVDETEDYVIYTSPILLNGKETNLRLVQYYSDDHIEVEGTWDGISDKGAACRQIHKLSEGDVITPLYYSYGIEDDEEAEYVGEEYVISGDIYINYDRMPEGEYYYSFCIDDIYGDYYMTEPLTFSIDTNGEIAFQ